MNPGCMVVLIAVAALHGVHAQELELAPEFLEQPACAVSDQQVVAATAGQKVTLDTPACTRGLHGMVSNTRLQMDGLYASFFKQAGLNLAESEPVSLLLVRRRLLTTQWSANTANHYQINKDSAPLKDIDVELQDHLTPEQLALLRSYEETLVGRTLLQPVASRLIVAGRPLSEAQWAEVLPATQQLIDGWAKNPRPKRSPDSLQACRDAHASMNRRDADVEKILLGSLDEEQRTAAHAYYQNLFEKRARSLRAFEELAADNAGAVGCSYHAN